MPGQPRLFPVDPSKLDARQREVRVKMGPFADELATNLTETLLNYPEFVRAIGRMTTRATLTSDLGPRAAQLAITRTAWLTECPYLWASHRRDCVTLGLTDDDLAEVARGGAALKGVDRHLVEAVDELHFTHYLSEEKWYRLGLLGHHAVTDLFIIYGLYVTLAVAANSMRVEIDADLAEGVSQFERLAAEPTTRNELQSPSDLPKRVFEADYAFLSPAQIEQTRRMGRRGKPTTSKLQRAMINYPDFLRALAPFGRRAIDVSDLPPRLWQLACMRTVWLCDSEYLWSQHRKVILTLGVTDEVLRGVAEGPDSPRLEGLDKAVVRAVDEMYRDHALSDASWATFAAMDGEAIGDLMLVHGLYILQSCLARTFGTTLEAGTPGYAPELRPLHRAQHR